jgi:hypothetical protein
MATVRSTHTVWTIDSAASRVEFAIRKRLFFVKTVTVTGRFTDMQGTIWLDEQEPAHSQADVKIGAASLTTRQARRDAHLRGADFFDVERHPTLIFTSRCTETVDRAARSLPRPRGSDCTRDHTRRPARCPLRTASLRRARAADHAHSHCAAPPPRLRDAVE